ncbi:hypothetical protein KC973_01415 [Candidatus Saccharibacteria bacterium]|nr:hypothetical protein [Candidatus Saccharibacteria bacterium]
MERYRRTSSGLYVAEHKLARVEHALGKDGPGAVRLPDVLDTDFLNDLVAELHDDSCVKWRDAGDTYVNGRGVQVVQNHDVFALKLSAGDQSYTEQVPLMNQLMCETEDFVQSLSDRYPSLDGWEADEMSYHRYYDPEVGLSFHRDNKRFHGVIVVITIHGASDFQVIDRTPVAWEYDEASGRDMVSEWHWGSTYTIPTQPGDMVLTRATGLMPWMTVANNPEHAVMNVHDLPRISFMVRANSRASDTAYGFEYTNWP